MPTTFHIDGSEIHDIASFYDVMNALLMRDEDWDLGPSLDALDDVLYGGIGALRDLDEVRFVWTGHERSRAALGVAATRAWLQEKVDRGAPFDTDRLTAQLHDLDTGRGTTYFELILEVFAGHPGLRLDLA
ncbi:MULTISPECIES: barstar family protein [unclassified Plantibacter]|uniref:barstar family protein n=1 Tax=unclassified Plantibacter TaxID=2624265 RepID=UPI000A53BD01|nr:MULTISPECIES: barstar family protein [unclassified Plantibacter]